MLTPVESPVSQEWLRELKRKQPYLTLPDIAVMAGVELGYVRAALAHVEQPPVLPGWGPIYKMTHIPD